MKNIEQKNYWEKRIDRFDAIYDDNKGLREITPLSKIVEPFRKKSLNRRFELAVGLLKSCGIRGKTFVDGGCGSGRMTSFLLDEGARKVYAVDITPRAIELSRQRINGENSDRSGCVEFMVGDVNKMALPKVDCFIGLGLVEYLDDIGLFIQNVSKSCSYVIVNFPLKLHWKRPIRIIVEFFEKSKRHYYSAVDIKCRFERYGFSLIAQKRFGASALQMFGKR
jgi:predicted RNA methylase